MEEHDIGRDQLHAVGMQRDHLHTLAAQTSSSPAGLQMQIGVSCWLQEAGFTILACFGDQWSDLSGPHAGLASFILPNPFYYLL